MAEKSGKLDTLHILIKAGIDALDRGDFVEIDEADLDAFLRELGAPQEGT
jgi:antitoxin ParD1/3/4